jgi:hypothetical protein
MILEDAFANEIHAAPFSTGTSPMSKSIPFRGWLLSIMLLLAAGCGDAGNQFAGGGLIVDDPDRPASSRDEEPAREETFREDSAGSRRSIWDNEDSNNSSRSSEDDADDDRPSRRMPSDTERWGSERKMPSDSMPSKTEKWGSERKMPSDSMPSRSRFRRSSSD